MDRYRFLVRSVIIFLIIAVYHLPSLSEAATMAAIKFDFYQGTSYKGMGWFQFDMMVQGEEFEFSQWYYIDQLTVTQQIFSFTYTGAPPPIVPTVDDWAYRVVQSEEATAYTQLMIVPDGDWFTVQLQSAQDTGRTDLYLDWSNLSGHALTLLVETDRFGDQYNAWTARTSESAISLGDTTFTMTAWFDDPTPWTQLTAVPEPATMLLLGTGLVGMAGFRRKIKKLTDINNQRKKAEL